MKKILKIALWVVLVLGATAWSIWYVNSASIPVLDPKGMIAEKEQDLIVTSFLLMLIVGIPVFLLLGVFAWKYRASNGKSKHAPDWEHNYIAEYCWWGVPVIIIVILGILTWKSSHELDPFKPIESTEKPLVIQVVALQWKWLFLYPEQKIATINYIQFPEKVPVQFEITSDAPMNSFWIPQLGGQIYAMPAMRSKLSLIANETGSFRGVSSNISGSGFAGMTFTAKASTPDEFAAWVAEVKKSPKQMTQEVYSELLKPTEYVPVSVYALDDVNLFDQILMKYMEKVQ